MLPQNKQKEGDHILINYSLKKVAFTSLVKANVKR